MLYLRMPRQFLSCCLMLCLLPLTPLQADELNLPAPGVMVHLSQPKNLPTLKGIKIDRQDPFKFEFVLSRGESVETRFIASQTTTLIKYFLASITTPEKDMWVNLSPYEKDHIVPTSFGQTQMGRDVLAQDYLLKQVTASLVYPEGEVGKEFWKRIYASSENKNISINVFNKVWIVPDRAVIYENVKTGTAYIVESSLKVLTEQDYVATNKNTVETRFIASQTTNKTTQNILNDIVIPQLTKEVNEGNNFAQLRQVYNSLILATWYKNKVKDSILNQVYANQNKIDGVNISDPQAKQKIYEQYLEAFKKGTFNYIKETQDPTTKEMIPRKYFSGGVVLNVSKAMTAITIEPVQGGLDLQSVEVKLEPRKRTSDVEVLAIKKKIKALLDLGPISVKQLAERLSLRVKTLEWYVYSTPELRNHYNLIRRSIRSKRQIKMAARKVALILENGPSTVKQISGKIKYSMRDTWNLINNRKYLREHRNLVREKIIIKQDNRDRAQLSSELSQEEFDARWADYVVKEQLDKYPLLLKQFTPAIKEALLDDGNLRPVFMQVLPVHALGKVQIPQHAAALADYEIDRKKVVEYMNDYSAFVVGDNRVAEDLLKERKGKIIVGVTDRETFTKRIYPWFRVANGRQVYYPLADGTWLGVKGSGQTAAFPPLLVEDIYDGVFRPLQRLKGGVSLQEARRAFNATQHFKGIEDGIVDFLGYRQIHEYPDGRGYLTQLSKPFIVNKEEVYPVLVFNRVLTPHRLIKFPQLVSSRDDFMHILTKLEDVEHVAGVLPQDQHLSEKNLVLRILENIGRVQAIKQNKGLYKITIHSQDFTLSGVESDNEEFQNLDEYKESIKSGRSNDNENVELLYRKGISVTGIKAGMAFLLEINKVLVEPQERLWVPDLNQGFQTLLRAYFLNLEPKYRQLWAQEVAVNIQLFKREFAQYLRRGEGVDWQALQTMIEDIIKDQAQLAKGGIDFNPSSIKLTTNVDGSSIQMQLDPATLKGLEQSTGFTPVIVNIAPLSSLTTFLNN